MSSEQCVGDFVSLQRGNTYKSSLLGQPGPYLLGLASIEREGGFRDDKLRTYSGPSAGKLLLYPGDIYVSLKDVTQSGDLLGSVARVPDSISVGRVTQDTVKLVFKHKDAPKAYLYWVLRSPQYRSHCRARAMGTTNLSLSREDFLSYPVPELNATRQQLVAALEAIEAKITLNHQINQTLEQMAQAIFKSWFVEFEPVRAKIAILEAGGNEQDALLAAMQAISGKGLEQLKRLKAESPEQYDELAATAKLFSSAMQESELGEIPEGWKVAPFSDVAKLDTRSVKPNDDPEKIWEHFSIPAFDEGKGPVLELGSDIKSNKYKVDPNCVLVSKLNPHFPRIWWSEPTDQEAAICSTEFMQFVPRSLELRPFMAGMIASPAFQQGIMMRVTGSTGSRQRAQPKQVATMDVVLPPETLVLEYSRRTASMNAVQASNIKQSQTLAQLRDTLLPQLLSGELTIPEAEEHVAEVADA